MPAGEHIKGTPSALAAWGDPACGNVASPGADLSRPGRSLVRFPALTPMPHSGTLHTEFL